MGSEGGSSGVVRGVVARSMASRESVPRGEG